MSILIEGELGYRMKKSFSRLESKYYKPEKIYVIEPGQWPGDWEGRTLLGVVMLAKTTGMTPDYLSEILEDLPNHLNEKGYFDKILPERQFDEQQLSGHNWFLRAMIELYLWQPDDKYYQIIKRLVENLYLPVTGYYKKYPTRPEDRVFKGDKSGTLTGSLIEYWYTSSDTGCAYMCLDGLAQAYCVFRFEGLKELLDEMIETFMRIDLLHISMQTHATLSATRGIMRLYQLTGETQYLEYVKRVFELYVKEGMTENYANYNWFGRSGWTEPCAIVDSYILAFMLYRETLDPMYLDYAVKIYYNGLGRAQRLNGGFGCDCCVGPEHLALRHDGKILGEAYWCCSMRGADGLSNVALNTFFEKDHTVYVNHLFPSQYQNDTLKLEVKTKMPYQGYIQMKASGKGRIKVYIPKYAKNVSCSVENCFAEFSVDGEETFTITFDIDVEQKSPLGNNSRKDVFSVWHGDLMLGCRKSEEVALTLDGLKMEAPAVYTKKDIVLQPINDEIDLELDDPYDVPVQVLFRK